MLVCDHLPRNHIFSVFFLKNLRILSSFYVSIIDAKLPPPVRYKYSSICPEYIFRLFYYGHHPPLTYGGFNVNKNDLIKAVADSADLTNAQAGKAVDSVVGSITGSLKKGQEVRLVGFGTFSVAKRKASKGRNPRTGEEIKIPASKQPKFKAGKALKEAVN